MKIDTLRPVEATSQELPLPGVDEAVAATVHEAVEADRKLREGFRLALFVTGKSEHRRAPIDPVERFRRNAARRRARGRKAPSLASKFGRSKGAQGLFVDRSTWAAA